uniref:EF-hand domain-containing protein n=1 Tax=Arundo donax TaxID=35708 RepID=A0A0A9HCX5_ARUDO
MAMAAVQPEAQNKCLFSSPENRTAITVQEFKQWLKQFDTDHDGRICRKELRVAIRRRGARFSGLRARFAIWRADRNHNGFVDDWEIENLIEFAEKQLGFKITMDAAPRAGQ